MKCYKTIIIILITFFNSKTILSNDKIFNVNKIEIIKKSNISNEELADQAIEKGYKVLINKILLREDIDKLSTIKFKDIKQLVSYYQLIKKEEDEKGFDISTFNISFDKKKIHQLFFNKNISYSEIFDREVYFLPILKKKDQIFVYNQNFFYQKWNQIDNNDLIEFILPLENIEILRSINNQKDNLTNLNIRSLFEEYNKKNLAIAILDFSHNRDQKVFIKTRISGKNINKNIFIDNGKLNEEKFNEKIITEIIKEITNIIKSQNLVDVRVPSFLNTKLIEDGNNLAELNKRLKKIDLIDDIFVQEFNKEYVLLKIKYLGKLDKIITQLESQNIILKLNGEEWSLKILR